MYRQQYAYSVLVNSVKRLGGCVHAASMDDAVTKIKQNHPTLVTVHKPSVTRPCDGATVPVADWMLDGKRAHVCVFAPATRF